MLIVTSNVTTAAFYVEYITTFFDTYNRKTEGMTTEPLVYSIEQ
jgi:hypothetical protein